MSTEAPLAGNATDAVIYQEEFFGAMTEVLQQNASVFNEASNNVIRLVARSLKGDFEKESFLKLVNNLIRDRDPDSNATVADKKMSMDEFIRVKTNKGIGPVSQTLDFWRKIGDDPSTMSFALGEMAGQEAAEDYVNNAIAAIFAAISAAGDVTYDATLTANQLGLGSADPHVRFLNQALKLYGDKAQRIRAWVMSGTTYRDLIDTDISEKVDGVAATTIYGGLPGTLGRPVIVTDSPSLDVAAAGTQPAKRVILGLVENAAEVAQSEEQYVTMQEVTGHENIIMRLQGESAYNMGVRGNKFTGTKNPALADFASSANWSRVVHDSKLGPGVALLVGA